ncbi:hypothetical protein H0H92_001002 [Tricholoma furcatifolium]|nr:hypothetical protein H0H92_001002 [Tricholoma furcatifolium]
MVKTPRRKRLTPAKRKKGSKTNASAKLSALPKSPAQWPVVSPPSGMQTGIVTPPSSDPYPSTLTPATPMPAPVATQDEDAAFWNPPQRREPTSSDTNTDEDDDDDDTPSTTSPTSTGSLRTPTSAERIRITRKTAIYDRVVGAMRGSRSLDIPHSKPLRSPIDDIAGNTRRFNHIIKDTIMRCERLSEETGCWLLLLAQLPTSKALTHYSSSRLRRDAKSDTLQIINQYQTTIRTLLAAKRDEAITIQKWYEDARRDLDNAEQARVAIQAQLVAKEAELAAREAELAQYHVAQ